MGAVKGMTVRIGGDTSELNKAIQQSNKEIKSTQTELKEVNKLLKLDPTNTELLKQKQQLLGQQIGQTTTKLEQLKEKQKVFDETIKKGGNVSQEEYRKLNREIESTEKSLNDLKQEAKETHPQLAKVGEAMKKAGEVAVSGAKAFANFTAIGVKALASACTTCITAVGGLAVKCGSLADDLNTLASTTGLSTKELQEFQYASDLIDVSVDTLAGALKKTTSAMVSAKEGTGKSAEAFKKLGVSVTDAQGNLRDNNDVFQESIKALGNIANETERDALAMQLFGKSATELNPLIEGGIDTLARMSEQANRLGLIMTQDMVDGANAFNDQLDILKANGKATFQVIGSAIASQLAPVLEEVNNYVMDIIQSLMTALNEGGLEGLAQELSTQFGNLLTKLVEELPKIAEFGIKIIQTLVDTFKTNASTLGSAGASLLTTLVEGFFTILPDIVKVVIDLVTSFGNTLAEELPTLIPIVVNGLFETLQSLIDNLPQIIDTIINIILAIVDTLTDPDNINKFIDGAIVLMQGLIEGLIKAIPKIVEALPHIIMAIVNGLIALVSKLWEVASPFFQALGEGLINHVTNLKDSIVAIWEWIKEALLNAFGKVVEVGANLVSGIWEGIKNAKDWLLNKIGEWCGSILEGVMSFFGIASPSKVFADEVGTNMAKGIGVGFANTMPSVIDAMQDKLASVTSAMQTELSFGDIPQIQGNQIISENSYVTKNYTNTIETIRQPQAVELVLDGTKLARTIIPPLNNEYNRLGVRI